MDPLTAVLIGLAVLGVVAAIWGIVTYQALIRLRNLVQEAWRQIDVELHRRHALVPSLLETVEGHATQEHEVFAEVDRARATAASGGVGPAHQAEFENALSDALSRLFAVAEDYPELSSSRGFADLQAELTTIEDRIAAGRRFYNANARELNTRIETFPSSLVARLFTFRRAEYFETNDPAVRAVPSGHFQGEPPMSAPGAVDGGPSFGGPRAGYGPRRDA